MTNDTAHQLFKAVQRDAIQELRALLAADPSVDTNAKDDKGNAPLFLAWSCDAVTLLLQHGADVDARNCQMETPLIRSVWLDDDVDKAAIFLDHGADVNAQGVRGKSALSNARSGAMVRLLVKRGANIRILDNDKCTPLFSLVQYRQPDALEELLRAGVEVDQADALGRTAIFNADTKAVMEVLVKYDASISTRSKFGEMALHMVVLYGELDAVRYLVEVGAPIDPSLDTKETPLYNAALRGKIETAQYLLDMGASVHGDPSFEKLPLVIAARCGHLNVIAELLARGAWFDPRRVSDEHSQTCLLNIKIIGISPVQRVPNHVLILDLLIEHCDVVIPKWPGSAVLAYLKWIRILESRFFEIAPRAGLQCKPMLDRLEQIAKGIDQHTEQNKSPRIKHETLILFGVCILKLWRWTLEQGHEDSRSDTKAVPRLDASCFEDPVCEDNLVECVTKVHSGLQLPATTAGILDKRTKHNWSSWKQQFCTCDQTKQVLEAASARSAALRKLVTYYLRKQKVRGRGEVTASNEKPEAVWQRVIDAAYALAALHEEGEVHGSLAPSPPPSPTAASPHSDVNSNINNSQSSYSEDSNGASTRYPSKSESTSVVSPDLPAQVEPELGCKREHEHEPKSETTASTRTTTTGASNNNSSDSSSYRASSHSVRWMSPETLRGASETHASEVYTFGMCIIEATSGEVPWGKVSSTVVRVLVDIHRLPRRPETKNMSDEQWELVRSMCARDPLRRPSMAEVAQKLKLIAKPKRTGELLREWTYND